MADPAGLLPGPVLVTGSTGTLGRPTVAALRGGGYDVRSLSRRPGPGRVVADLRTGVGLKSALHGVHTVIHLATTATRDVALGRTLVAAASRADVRHLIVMSIVGVDLVPLPYYRTKLAVERIVESTGLPYTIVRSTQFHDLVTTLFAAQRISPLVFAPAFAIQPIEVTEVAARLVELAAAGAAVGRTEDIGGPQTRTARDLALAWKRATGSRRPIRTLRLPGRTFAAYVVGSHLVPGVPYGKTTFEEYLAAGVNAPRDDSGPAARDRHCRPKV
jgi:uncharacterized protein YbjT (DUF2867 family)